MKPQGQTYTWHEIIEGVHVVGFVDRGPADNQPDATFDRDFAEFKRRLQDLGKARDGRFAVVDFANYQMTLDNGRSMVAAVLGAHKRLKAGRGGILVCNHPAQFNPDFQWVFHFDRAIDVYRSQREALAAARSLQIESEYAPRSPSPSLAEGQIGRPILPWSTPGGGGVHPIRRPIDLCNRALAGVRPAIPADLFRDVDDDINRYDEWGLGMEVLIDHLCDFDIKITGEQFSLIHAAMASMGLGECERVKYLRVHCVTT
jgi:hypothetical protein